MKKILTGLAAGALALGVAMPASAGFVYPTTVYDAIVEIGGEQAELILDASGLAGALQDCGNTGDNNNLPDYTVFFPADPSIWGFVLLSLDLTFGELLAQPALLKAALLNHTISGNVSPSQMEDDSNKVFNTMGGLKLLKGASPAVATGYVVNNQPFSTEAIEACNGWVYPLFGFLSPSSASTTDPLDTDGSTTVVAGSEGGLPKTGTESMALAYAALASLIAGAGVLVIRRRSVA